MFAGTFGGSSVDTGDGDGRLDIVTPLGVVLQTADSVVENVQFAPRIGESLALADLTGDGRPEIIAAAYVDSEIYVLRNRCTGFRCRADVDGDGELTIFDFLAFQNAFDAGCP